MAVSSPGSGTKTELQLWRERRHVSPDRTVIWTEPPNPKLKKVPVLYYLCRNGHLDHPHFMEVPLSSPHGLFLKDVISRLNLLRGKGMASMYSWSCKRSYKNGFVWHDLSEMDLIHPTHGQEYVLKGSELQEHMASPESSQLPTPSIGRRRNQSCSSIDFEYNSIHKTEPSGRSAAADAFTQTLESLRRRCRSRQLAEEDNSKQQALNEVETEIEISPSPSDSSPETLGTLMKAEGRVALRPASSAAGRHDGGEQRCKSSVLMQLISCGSIPFGDCGAGQGLGLIGPNKTRVPRGVGTTSEGEKGKGDGKECPSGSLDQTKKAEVPALKRSASYNTDGSLHLELPEKEMEGVKANCLPRKPKAQSSCRKEGHSCNTSSTVCINGCT